MIPSFSRSCRYGSLMLKSTISLLRSLLGTLDASSVARMTSVGDAEVVREQEPGAVGGEVDRRDPLLQVDRAARLQELRDRAREELALHAREVRRHERDRLVDLALQVRRDRELRDAQLDRREEPRLEARARRHEVPHVVARAGST